MTAALDLTAAFKHGPPVATTACEPAVFRIY